MSSGTQFQHQVDSSRKKSSSLCPNSAHQVARDTPPETNVSVQLRLSIVLKAYVHETNTSNMIIAQNFFAKRMSAKIVSASSSIKPATIMLIYSKPILLKWVFKWNLTFVKLDTPIDFASPSSTKASICHVTPVEENGKKIYKLCDKLKLRPALRRLEKFVSHVESSSASCFLQNQMGIFPPAWLSRW